MYAVLKHDTKYDAITNANKKKDIFKQMKNKYDPWIKFSNQ